MQETLAQLQAVIASRQGGDASVSYVARLFAKGDDAILKKIGEEAAEVIIAAKGADASVRREQVVYESADLLFHLMVLLSAQGLSIEEVVHELARREGVSGIAEKLSRVE